MDSIAFYRKLPATKLAQALGIQYIRSSTSVNSNYRAARRARSTKEFIAKLGNVVEEADEALEWLNVLHHAQIAHDSALLSEANQLCAIFTAALKTAKKNQKKRRKRDDELGNSGL